MAETPTQPKFGGRFVMPTRPAARARDLTPPRTTRSVAVEHAPSTLRKPDTEG